MSEETFGEMALNGEKDANMQLTQSKTSVNAAARKPEESLKSPIVSGE